MAKALNSDNRSFKPNALILGYPILDLLKFCDRNREVSPDMNIIIEMMCTYIYGSTTPTQAEMVEWDLGSRITSTYPPTFLWTTMEDSLVDVEQSMNFIRDLASHKVPYEFHIFEKGSRNTPKWIELALDWLKERMDST